ncbi:MAG: NnrU family protein [Erythrobacter sp.]
MDGALISLAFANFAFVGTHFVMSHTLRRHIEALIGRKFFPVLYSLVSLAIFAWIVIAFRAAPTADLPGTGEGGWIIATVLLIPALVLWTGSFIKNPAMPMPGASEAARTEPRGVFAVTRHPMMWSFALWALSHLILFYSWRTMITAGAMGFLALYGSHLQDRKKRAQMGEDWELWQSRTQYWPRWHKLFTAGGLVWAVALIVWVFFSWLHLPAAGIPAGIWRWF